MDRSRLPRNGLKLIAFASPRWTCTALRHAWAEGDRRAAVRAHIENCAACRTAIIADPRSPLAPIDPPFGASGARSLFSRRRLFLAAAAGAIAIGLGVVGMRASATRNPAAETAPRIPAIERRFGRLDQAARADGPAVIIERLLHAPYEERKWIIEWAVNRKRTEFAPTLVACLMDPDIHVRRHAVNALWTMPADVLRPERPAIERARDRESDPVMRAELADLATTIGQE